MIVPRALRLTKHQVQLLWLLRDGGTLYCTERSPTDKTIICWIEYGEHDYIVRPQGFHKMMERKLLTKMPDGVYIYSGVDLFGKFDTNGPGWAENPRKKID